MERTKELALRSCDELGWRAPGTLEDSLSLCRHPPLL
jgi:hypothetical protein